MTVPVWANTSEIATRYRVCVKTIRAWCKARLLPFVRRGRIVLFHVQSCDDAMKAIGTKSVFMNKN